MMVFGWLQVFFSYSSFVILYSWWFNRKNNNNLKEMKNLKNDFQTSLMEFLCGIFVCLSSGIEWLFIVDGEWSQKYIEVISSCIPLVQKVTKFQDKDEVIKGHIYMIFRSYGMECAQIKHLQDSMQEWLGRKQAFSKW